MDLLIGWDVKDGINEYMDGGYWYEFMSYYWPVYQHRVMRLEIYTDYLEVLELDN